MSDVTETSNPHGWLERVAIVAAIGIAIVAILVIRAARALSS